MQGSKTSIVGKRGALRRILIEGVLKRVGRGTRGFSAACHDRHYEQIPGLSGIEEEEEKNTRAGKFEYG